MSEGAPVNAGAATAPTAWPSPERAAEAVQRMQIKLHRWAGEDSSRRFDDLFNLVYDPAFLLVAFIRVAANTGARTAGIDGATVARIRSGIGVRALLEELRDALKTGRFEPVEVRRVEIPKASGKIRKLGIPTVADRVVQASLKLVLEPIFEAGFQPCSYGFRPNRRAQDAVAEIHHLASGNRNYHWILEADIRACFDQIDHTALMARVRARIKDKRICALVRAFLKAGVMTATGDREDTWTGTPQGGILSPLLANIALSALDDHFASAWQQQMGSEYQRARRKRRGMANYKLVRYADDFVVMVSGDRHHAEALRAEVAAVIAPLGLALADDKTRVVHIDEGFDFLGIRIRRQLKRGTSKSYVYTTPSRKAVASIRAKVKAMTYRSTRNGDLEDLLAQMNRVLSGWARYFRYGPVRRVFAQIDYFAWGRLMRWIRAKHHAGMKGVRRKFCVPGSWRITSGKAAFAGASSVTSSRYRYRGNTIPTPWTLRPAAP